jgi:Ser/Thr protein kinase RdoA (MazF antagonist)
MTDGAPGRTEELNRRGQEAAVALASRLGLAPAEPAVLSSRGNLLLHLAPAPIVARVATLTAFSRRDPFAWLAREVAVAGHAAARGGPVVAPSRLIGAGPYWQDGFAVSFWDYLPADPRRPSLAAVGAALASLHEAAAGCPADLGELRAARDQVTEGLEALERESVLPAAAIRALRARHEDVLARLHGSGYRVVLHGDVHAGNLLAVGSEVGQGDLAAGWSWIDLEETSRGPVEWDLATMVAEKPAPDAEAALRAYAERSGRPVCAVDTLAPFHEARMLEAVVWTSCMAYQYPARYRDQARDRLTAFLAD